MMKTNAYRCLITLTYILFCISISIGQSAIKKINKVLTQDKIYADMMFIASDALKGRKTGEPGNQAAAEYIAHQLMQAGVQPLPGRKDFYQAIPFVRYSPPHEGRLMINEVPFDVNNNIVILEGGEVMSDQIEAIYADFGWIDSASGRDDYKDLDVKGKYVIVQGGPPMGGSPLEVFASMPKKRQMAQSKGALGLIEIYNLGFSWSFFRNYFNKERLEIIDSNAGLSNIFHAWIQAPSGNLTINFTIGKTYQLALNTPGAKSQAISAVNVLGVIPGKNKILKDQFVMLSAHFDHIGVHAGQPIDGDTIWNGARDNAWGTVSLIAAARFLAKYPQDRSVLIAAVNGEEIGLLGSKYLAEHPVIPWHKVIFDLNSDGAGYADTTLISVIGLNRVGAAKEISSACNAFGLNTFADPAPEQGLFDRSDNVNFARLGVPSPTFSSGFQSFDATIGKYYHQSIDNPDNISYGYLLRFIKAFTLSAIHIANMKQLPRWTSGDKYELAAKRLYSY